MLTRCEARILRNRSTERRELVGKQGYWQQLPEYKRSRVRPDNEAQNLVHQAHSSSHIRSTIHTHILAHRI